jgi:hypothetical protein
MDLNSIEYDSENSIQSSNRFEFYYDDQESISISNMLNDFNPIGDETDEIIPALMPIRSNLFIVRDTTNDTTLSKNKKRGRKTNLKKERKTHDKFSADNILRKIQVHFISFIVFFLNDILRSFAIKERFLKLDYKFINDVKKQNFAELKNKNIGDIISNKISTKYKKDENTNINLYELLKSNKVLGKIFNIKYIDFFEKYYMKKEKTVDLRKFGKEEEITLSNKTKTYYEFLEKEKSKAKDEIYIKEINECLNKYYLTKQKFVLY